MAPRGAHALPLVVDVRRRAEGLFEPPGAHQRRGAPDPVDVLHLLGDVEVARLADLLQDQPHREDGRQVVGADRLPGSGVQHGRQRLRQVGLDVVPLLRHVAFVQEDLDLAHRSSSRGV